MGRRKKTLSSTCTRSMRYTHAQASDNLPRTCRRALRPVRCRQLLQLPDQLLQLPDQLLQLPDQLLKLLDQLTCGACLFVSVNEIAKLKS